jgi:hypothetical protein
MPKDESELYKPKEKKVKAKKINLAVIKKVP